MRKIVPFNNVLTFNTDVYEITAISLEHSLEKEVDSLSGVFYISGEYKILNGGINPEQFNFELPFDIALGTRYDMSSMVVDIDDFRYELVDNNKMKVNIDLYIDGEETELEDNQLLEEVPLIKELNLQEVSATREEIPEDNVREQDVPEVAVAEEVTAEELSEQSQTNDEGDELMNSQSEEINNVEETLENDIKRESDLVKELIYNDEEENETSISNHNNINIDNHNETNILNNISDEENYVTYKVYRIVEGDTLDSILTKYKVTKEELLSYNDNISNLLVGDKLIIPFK